MSAINEKAVNGTQLQRTHKKIYRHLMPLLIVAYIISFIDRTNIGMAKATMSVDIGLSATAFGLGAGLFFLTYAVLEIPSNLFLTRIGARRWIARIMITWGILSCGMAFVTGPTSFYVMRLLLGSRRSGTLSGHYLLPHPLVWPRRARKSHRPVPAGGLSGQYYRRAAGRIVIKP